MLGGFALKIERWQELLAWHACNIMNVWLPRGKKMRMSKLLPKSRKVIDVSQYKTREEVEAAVARARQEV